MPTKKSYPYGGELKRVGVAFTRSRAGRVDEYGIYRFEGGDKEYAKYEGYREGGWMVGLPLAGPNAAHTQPLIDFNPHHFEKVTYFKSAAFVVDVGNLPTAGSALIGVETDSDVGVAELSFSDGTSVPVHVDFFPDAPGMTEDSEEGIVARVSARHRNASAQAMQVIYYPNKQEISVGMLIPVGRFFPGDRADQARLQGYLSKMALMFHSASGVISGLKEGVFSAAPEWQRQVELSGSPGNLELRGQGIIGLRDKHPIDVEVLETRLEAEFRGWSFDFWVM